MNSCQLACQRRNRHFFLDALPVGWQLLYIVMTFEVFYLEGFNCQMSCRCRKDVNQNWTMRTFYRDVVVLQDLAKSLHKDCVARKEPAKCLFPEEIIKHISTPVFLVNPAYDFWQIQHILIPEASDPHGYWKKCKLNIYSCNPSQIEILQGFRRSILNALSEFQKNKEGGTFINSCFIHCQTWFSETWHSPSSPRINNKTIAESVGDWYFNRNVAKQIDCPFPCNPTCYHMNFTQFSRG